MEPLRVLQVVTIMNRGGVETMLMNYYRNIDRSKLQFDFIVHREERGAYDDEIESLGGKIYRAPKIRPWTYIEYFKWLNHFFKEHHNEYVAVHGHLQENSGFTLYYAKKYCIPNRLMSSHIALVYKDHKFLFRQFARLFFKKSATQFLSCGTKAGKYLYKKSNFLVIPNAIESDKFTFNKVVRDKIRREFQIPDSSVLIGHVGRFNEQKNHNFLIDIFNDYHKKYNDSYLILIGDGDLLPDIREKVANLNLSDSVIFTGSRNDIPMLLQGMDIFLMPSLYEGLPVSVIEAQAAGLPCVLSDTIDNEVNITGNVSFVSLDSPICDWISNIEKAIATSRIDTSNIIKAKNYDVTGNIPTLMRLYGIEN